MSKKHDFIAGRQTDRRDNIKIFIDQAAIDGTKYLAYFMIGDEAVGQASDEITISVNV